MLQERNRPIRNDDQPGDTPLGGGLAQTRASMDDFYRAGVEAIDNALSGNSDEFLRVIRQHSAQ